MVPVGGVSVESSGVMVDNVPIEPHKNPFKDGSKKPLTPKKNSSNSTVVSSPEIETEMFPKLVIEPDAMDSSESSERTLKNSNNSSARDSDGIYDTRMLTVKKKKGLHRQLLFVTALIHFKISIAFVF